MAVMMDVDPGCDDAVALVAACGAVDLRCVTAVAGNVPLRRAVANALSVLELAGRPEIPVGVGARGPLCGGLRTAEHIHGKDGLGGVALPVGGEPSGEAVGLMARTVGGESGPVTLVAVGPLTNVALFMRREPGCFQRLERLVVMGGSLGEGNVTPHAEFNFHTDPEAAAEVLGCGMPITLVSLDVTRLAVAGGEVIGRLQRLGEVGEKVGALAGYGGAGPDRALHDAVAVAAAAEPGLVTTRQVRVDVVLEGERRGKTVCAEGEPNVEVGVGLEVEGFMKWLVGAVDSAQKKSAYGCGQP